MPPLQHLRACPSPECWVPRLASDVCVWGMGFPWKEDWFCRQQGRVECYSSMSCNVPHRTQLLSWRHGSYHSVWGKGGIITHHFVGMATAKYSVISTAYRAATVVQNHWYTFLCNCIFRNTGIDVMMQKETEKYSSALDSLQTKIVRRGQIRVKQNFQPVREFLYWANYYSPKTWMTVISCLLNAG